MRSSRTILLALLAAASILVAATARVRAQEPDAPLDSLASIHQDLVELRFEQAEARLNTMLAAADLSEQQHADALVLLSQAHVASGDLNAVERDYRAILELRPGYQPDPNLTPNKAMERFRKVRAKTVGRLVLQLDPPDADLRIDGRDVVPDDEGGVIVVAGERIVAASRSGFDPLEHRVEVPAAGEATIELRLVANARTVVLRTDPEGVEVLLDGEPVGVTVRSRASRGDPPRPAELVLENLPLGEHTFEFVKECHRSERRSDILAVDLMARDAKVFDVVRMAPVRSSLAVDGKPEGAEVFVDGRSVGWLPVNDLDVCPGIRRVEVRRGARLLWARTETAAEGEDVRLTVRPLPNVVLAGTKAAEAGIERWDLPVNLATLERGPSTGRVAEPDAWASLELRPDVDLVLTVVRGSSRGMPERWFAYSPILKSLAEVRPDELRATLERPVRWRRPAWGLTVIDSEAGGAALVVNVREGGPASDAGMSVGARIVEVGGRAVTSSKEVRATLDVALTTRPLGVRWIDSAGETVSGELRGVLSPALDPNPDPGLTSLVRAAWAAADSQGAGADASSALANLAMLFSAHGRRDAAVKALGRVSWAGRSGVGEGTLQYLLGRELQALGREKEAVEAYRRAAASRATAYHDDGVEIAPAAADHLAELGVSLTARR